MKVLVTGGAGFIGSHISDALLAAGHAVCIADNLSTGKRENVPSGADFHVVDIRSEDLVRLVEAYRPDAICHQAAQTSVSVSTKIPREDAETNVLGTIQVLEAARRSGVKRVVYAGTGGAVYGDVPEGIRATVGVTPPRPSSPYACSKLAGEHYLQAYAFEHGLEPIVLRYANVYGPRQDPHGEAGVVAIFCQRLSKGESIAVYAKTTVGDEGCVRDYVHVSDVVRANVAALSGALAVGTTLNVCTGVATTTLALAKTLGEVLQLDLAGKISFGPRRSGDVARSVLDPGPYEAQLGQPRSLRTGLVDTAAWFSQR